VTRNLMGLAAAVALLGSGYGPRSVQAVDDWDEESRMKRKALEDACLREREEMRLAANRRLQERARRAVEAKDLAEERIRKLNAGIDPTNDRPLSRQQRRAREKPWKNRPA
jgi:hypothetical protein